MKTVTPEKPLVLIVDDTPINIQILAESLAKDYRIKVAGSGRAAFEILEKHVEPDLILLDVMMPDMDGYSICTRLKQNPETSNIPVIFITAMSEAADEERGLNLGAADYITKPFHLPIVKARIQNHIKFKLMTDLLESMAWQDGLTGISNRRSFDEALEKEWKRAQRAGSSISLVLVDIDHFKEYNDNYGHGAGDDCLKEIATTIASFVTRAGDMVARYGGEEFVLLIPETGVDGARQLAEQLCCLIDELRIQHAYSPTAPRVTISAGYASAVPMPDESASILLAETDRMLYLAKNSGRNRAYGSTEESAIG